MKNLTMNMTLAAAALVLAAGAAQAQQLKAEIPFSFRAQGSVMPAGEYRVEGWHSRTSSEIFKLTHVDTNRAILVLPYQSNSASPERGATLRFQCVSSNCALDQIDPGAGQTYALPTPKLGKGEDARVAVIRAVLVK